MNTKHFHVYQAFPGCIPEGDDNNIHMEESSAIEEVDELAEHYKEEIEVEGVQQEVIGEKGSGYYEVVYDRSVGSGFYITYDECDNNECIEELESEL